MPHVRAFQAALAAAVLFAAPAVAQAPAAKIEAAERRTAVAQAAKELRARYVFPEVGERAAAALEQALAAGAYDAIEDRGDFAERLTGDLARVARDKHIRVYSRSAPRPPPPGGPPPRSEGGFVRADRLAGGVGYVEVMGFPGPDIFKPAADRAMASLAGSRAIIIDLRRNGGGDPRSVAYLLSFLLPPDTHVNDFVSRNEGTDTFRRSSFRTIPVATDLQSTPVSVLVSGRTFSGGEEFAYDITALKRGVLLGEVTGGGANPGGMWPISPDLSLFVPDGRAENPVTKTNWEGVGVAPDVAAPAGEALRVALSQLGVQAAAGEVDALSQARLFRPRTTEQPGAEAAQAEPAGRAPD